MLLRINQIAKSFASEVVLTNITFEMREAQSTVLLGPSGSGKTTLFRILSGLIPADSGTVLFDPENINSKPSIDWFQSQRGPLSGVGFVFQELRLFPHLSCLENCKIGLQSKNLNLLYELADDLNISEVLAKRPHHISRGQAQRVAILRALVKRPKLLLLDEPTASLDVKTKKRVNGVLRSFSKERNCALLTATHDISIISTLADSLYLINNGSLKKLNPQMSISDIGKEFE